MGLAATNIARRLLSLTGAILVALAASGAGANGLVGIRAAAESAGHLDPAAPAPAAGTPVVGAVPVVSGVELSDTPDAARLTFSISAPVTASAFTLASPDRVIVDLGQVDFQMDARVGHVGSGRFHHVKKGLIGSFRFGLLAPGRSRIVIDLAHPARVTTAETRTDHGRTVLVVSLAKSDPAAFAAHAKTLTATAAPSAPIVASAPTAGKPTIVIDAGHGGPDTGAIVNGVVEKDVTLAFAKMLAAKLEATGAFTVVMSRSSDVFVALSDRVQIARGAGAALMISIHADTLPETSDVSGATVYTVSDRASDAYAAKVAAKENDADSDVGIDGQRDKADVNDILFDLTRQETRAYSHVFSRTLVNYWKVAGRLNKNPQRSAGFVVLKAPDVPSVLVELGYLSNPVDAAALNADDWRQKATGCMADAVIAYFADQRGPQKAAAGVTMPLVRQAHAD